jgi:hypothetical protein
MGRPEWDDEEYPDCDKHQIEGALWYYPKYTDEEMVEFEKELDQHQLTGDDHDEEDLDSMLDSLES